MDRSLRSDQTNGLARGLVGRYVATDSLRIGRYVATDSLRIGRYVANGFFAGRPLRSDRLVRSCILYLLQSVSKTFKFELMSHKTFHGCLYQTYLISPLASLLQLPELCRSLLPSKNLVETSSDWNVSGHRRSIFEGLC
ncbi:hypothetical protein DY000_02040958 [Brassica cretica]|uniref:Uncharacterized protein n=1 Tax=Brassica cretica TaxID=69181 RepID=A0ABQ7B9S6_BRACR|nr:hypothetical protein DY000_02040958 [Brassica cretica]